MRAAAGASFLTIGARTFRSGRRIELAIVQEISPLQIDESR
jgi:hypothetical protein